MSAQLKGLCNYLKGQEVSQKIRYEELLERAGMKCEKNLLNFDNDDRLNWESVEKWLAKEQAPVAVQNQQRQKTCKEQHWLLSLLNRSENIYDERQKIDSIFRKQSRKHNVDPIMGINQIMTKKSNLNLRLLTKETTQIYSEMLFLRENIEFMIRKRQYIEHFH